MRIIWIFVAGVVVGVAIGFAFELKYHSNQITFVIANTGRPSIAPKHGDTITWLPEGTSVTFEGYPHDPSPCEGLTIGDNSNPCTVRTLKKGEVNGFNLYDCKGCTDPDLGPVGPKSPISVEWTKSGKTPKDAPAATVQVSCHPQSTTGKTVLANGGGLISPTNETTLNVSSSIQTIVFSSSADGLTFIPPSQTSLNCTGVSCTVPANASGNLTVVVSGAACKGDPTGGGATEYISVAQPTPTAHP